MRNDKKVKREREKGKDEGMYQAVVANIPELKEANAKCHRKVRETSRG